MKISKLISLLALLSVCACSPDKSLPTYTSFPVTIPLQGEAVKPDTPPLRYPFRIRIRGNRAAVMDLHGTDYFCHLFSYPDFRYLSSLGRRGEAADELLSAEDIRWQGDTLLVLDANRARLNRFSVEGNRTRLHPPVPMDAQLLRALNFVQYGDTAFLIPDYTGDSRLCIVSRQGKLLRKAGEIPTANKAAMESQRPALAQAWRSFIDYNPHCGVLAAATQLGEVLEVYHPGSNTHTVVAGPHGEPEFKVAQGYGIPTGIIGFSDVQVTDSAIYAVFHGRTFREITENARKGIRTPDGGKHIYVFSLQGKPLRAYHLDRHIYGIAVDEADRVIMATDVNSDTPIVRYRF